MKTELLDAYLCGDLRGESAEFIEAALKSDAALREVYFQQVRMDAALRVILEDEELAEVSPSQFTDSIMARIASEPPVESEADRQLAKSVLMEILEERSMKPRPMVWMDWAKAAAITAAAAAITVFLLQSVSVSDTDENFANSREASQRFVARITSQKKGTSWATPTPLYGESGDAGENDDAIVNDDGWVKPGRLTIESGVAEITFNSGARVFLEGPAIFEVERPDRAFLERGRLTAEVPKPATGFVINTPRVNVVDIGTRFGVSVDELGDTEVHVMEGIVEVSRLTGNAVPMVVEEGLAVRADGRTRSELQVIEYAGDRFALRVEDSEEPQSLRFLHYAFDESGGSEIEDGGRGIEGGPFYASLLPETERPTRSVGKFGGALVFEPGERFDSPILSGFHRTEPLSVGLWVRIPPRPQNFDANSILTLASHADGTTSSSDRDSAPWRIAWNADADEGIAGALRVESGDGFAVGSSDLRDGRWHHVGFRFVGGDSSELASHLHLFVDGHLEDISGHRASSTVPGNVGRLQLGGRSGEPVFEGAVDEVYAFPDAVPTNVIQDLAGEGPAR